MGEASTVSSSASSDSSGSTSVSSGSSSSSSSSSSSTSSDDCRYAHLDKDWCPGTTKLRDIAREIADENDCPTFSKKICKKILKRMEGMRFFRSIKSKTSDDDSSDSDSSDSDSDSDSDSSDDNSSEGEYGFGCYTKDDEVDIDDEDDVEEIRPKELYDAIRPFYVGERYMIQMEAHCRDVYFKHPNHPGTQAFVRASQQLVIRLGVARSYDERTYKKMLKLLYDSKFFVGKAPECVEADEEDCDRIFRARYEFDRKMIQRIILENRQSRPIPGTVCIKCCCRRKKDPEKKNCIMKLLNCLPKALGIPVLVVISFFSFGFIYFGIWYVFKIILTTIYVILGVSMSYLLGGDDEEEEVMTEGEAVKEAVEEIIEETIEEVAEVVERNLRNFW